MKTQSLRNKILFIFLMALSLFFIANLVSAKENNIVRILESGKLPSSLKLVEKMPQIYRVTTDYFNGDINGNFFGKERYQGTYTRALPDGKVKWENVTSEKLTSKDAAFGDGTPLSFLNGFCYETSADMLKDESFPGFPPADVNAKNLVWDMIAFEGFAWEYFDSLKLNEYISASSFNQKVIMGATGTFTNKNVLLKWTGISLKNNEPCAVVEFLVMDNPLEINFGSENLKMSAKGRSHYWGTILVSLVDKQIEGATLHEDVLLNLSLPDGAKQLANSTRLITVEKLTDCK